MLTGYEVVFDEHLRVKPKSTRNVYRVKKDNVTYCYKDQAYYEYEALLHINHESLPKIIDYKDGRLIKEWVEGEPLDCVHITPTKELIRNFTKYTKELFDIVHSSNYILLDYTLENIAYNEGQFRYFDFDSSVRFDVILTHLLGSGRHFSRPYESLLANVHYTDDYFAYAGVIYTCMIGSVPYLNDEKNSELAKKNYQTTYKNIVPKFTTKLLETGLSKKEVDFIIACLNPFQTNRPTSFL